MSEQTAKHYLLASDFDQTLSFKDSGVVLSELIGFHGFHDKVDGLSQMNLVQQGAAVANGIARRMVVPPHREGGQAQYVARPLPRAKSDTVTGVLSWMERHLDREVTVEELALRAHMSPRTFARRFQQETGTTPYRWLLGQRVLLARELLEGTDATVDSVAVRAGFGNAATMRHHFVRWTGTTPGSMSSRPSKNLLTCSRSRALNCAGACLL